MFQLVIAIFLFFCAFTVRADCNSLLTERLNTDLALPYASFDQTPGNSWRELEARKCYREAAILIEHYVRSNNATQRSLKWHLLQMYAFAGENKKAVEIVSAVLLPDEQTSKSPLLWNDYVLATSGFLEKDFAKLKFHRDQIAKQGKGFKPNEMNMAVLDRLIDNFGQTYQMAYIVD
ncbi:hypothetical protein [Rheinheimera sp.]|uniref:hypothetical protein n=1 Tax=Rheinheimera sp. TaxID=1869214 RepID=UPI00307EDCFA